MASVIHAVAIVLYCIGCEEIKLKKNYEITTLFVSSAEENLSIECFCLYYEREVNAKC